MRRLVDDRDRELVALDVAFEKERTAISARGEPTWPPSGAHEEDVRRFDADEAEARTKLQAALQDALWAANSFLEAGLRRAQKQQDSVRHQVEELHRQGEQLKADFVPLLKPVGIDLEEVQRRRRLPEATH